MSQIMIYPRQYRVLVPGEGQPLTSRGDQAVTELYQIYRKGDKDTRGLTFRFKVLECAVRLFGDFREWMMLQRNNPTLVGYNLKFLRDTMGFILHGERQLSPLIWGDLLQESNDYASTQHHLVHSDLAIPEDLTTEQVLQLWCSRRGGFEDLIQTLFVLFGTERGEGR